MIPLFTIICSLLGLLTLYSLRTTLLALLVLLAHLLRSLLLLLGILAYAYTLYRGIALIREPYLSRHTASNRWARMDAIFSGALLLSAYETVFYFLAWPHPPASRLVAWLVGCVSLANYTTDQLVFFLVHFYMAPLAVLACLAAPTQEVEDVSVRWLGLYVVALLFADEHVFELAIFHVVPLAVVAYVNSPTVEERDEYDTYDQWYSKFYFALLVAVGGWFAAMVYQYHLSRIIGHHFAVLRADC